ncbi:hypothetical protein ACFLQ4_00475 [Bacteroidota bacterium]
MKTTLTILLFLVFILVGCTENSADLTSPDAQITQQSNPPSWVKLPGDGGQGFSIESEYSAQKIIKGSDGGVINLNVTIERPGHEFGDLKFKAKVKVRKHSFPDDEERLFTITMDPDNAYLNISPSPNTLSKHLKVSWQIKGIDVSEIDPETFDFIYVADNSEILVTSKEELIVDYARHKIKVKNAKIHPTHPENSSDGTRYGFVNRREKING